MKRYEMTAEYNRYACSDEVIPVESADGDWIKFSDYQAATEAAKATGTTGELPEGWKIVPRKMIDEQAREIVYNINRKYKGNPMSDYLARAVWEWGIYASPNPPAEAARQPAPALSVKTWQERLKESASEGWTTLSETHMQAEIADLRTALAATAAPVLSDEQRERIEFAARILQVEGFDKEATELFAIHASTAKG